MQDLEYAGIDPMRHLDTTEALITLYTNLIGGTTWEDN